MAVQQSTAPVPSQRRFVAPDAHGTTAWTVRMWRTGVLACVAAAVATTAISAVAKSAGVPVEIDGEPIPAIGFAQLTLLFSAMGVGLAYALRRWAAAPKRAFFTVTAVLIVLSIVPDLLVSATTATRLTLITTHLVAAAIVVPLVAGRLPARRQAS
ncbi:hypothetical protein E1293_28320 [Actinomadura darangshiensis]|uniref:Cell envelope biogenesis protein OmpA n=1 Tax=Actinomadura darangshiensis TaxID=705336 RepID=A0A4V6PEN4_9ACTN|nr:DUF6069 family protein [Actinomadura darangshiensis]TDD75407.1 hypothetical protein E1293_28320 [Actinomadura darangshiensis]